MVEDRIREILSEYAGRITEIEREYRKKMRGADDELRLMREREDAEIKVDEWVVGELEKVLDEVVFEAIDSCTPWSGNGFKHSYVVYKVGAKRTGDVRKVIVFFAEFHEGDVHGVYKFELERVWSEEQVVVNENTPFTQMLVENIPWLYIRETWRPNIEKMIADLAIAEHDGRLDEGINEVRKRLEAGLWIYDYCHVYRALEETIKSFKRKASR